MTLPSLPRRLTVLVFGLFPVLTSMVAPARPSFAGRLILGSVPQVPYPRSAELLRTLTGERHVFPPVQRDQYPERVNGKMAFDPAESQALLQILYVGNRRLEEHLGSMLRLARSAGGRGAPLQPEEGFDAVFQEHLAAIDALAESTRFQELRPFSGMQSHVFLFHPQPGLEPVQLELGDSNTDALYLEGADIGTMTNARTAIDPIEDALEVVTSFRAQYRAAERAILPGVESGLGEVERTLLGMRELALDAAQASLTTGDRWWIEVTLQGDRARLQAVDDLTRYGALALLEGGEVWLGTARSGVNLHYRLPELPDLSEVEVTTLSAAEWAITRLDGAIATVQEERARAAALLPVLTQQLGHPGRR